MRIGLMIIGLAAIAVGLVSLRRDETRLSYEIQQLAQKQQLAERSLWDRKVEVSQLIRPAAIQERMAKMNLDMTNDEPTCSITDQRVGLP